MAVAPVNSVALSDQLDEAKFISFPDSPYQLYQLFQLLVINQLPLLSWWRASMTDYFFKLCWG
jgi:hypothetical protein